MSERTPKLASLLSHKISQYFKIEMDLPGLVSISAIETAPNMQSAVVWISIYGASEDEVLKMLRKEVPYLRKYLAKNISTRYIPKISFRADHSEAHAQHIGELMRDLNKE